MPDLVAVLAVLVVQVAHFVSVCSSPADKESIALAGKSVADVRAAAVQRAPYVAAARVRARLRVCVLA